MKFLLLLLIFIWSNAAGQTWHLKKQIDWIEPDAGAIDLKLQDILRFRFAGYPDNDITLPVYTEVTAWFNEYPAVKAKIFSAHYEPLPDKFKNNKLFSDIPFDIVPEVDIAVSRNKPQLIISLVPFRKNPENGNPERLISFILEIEPAVVGDIEQARKKSGFVNNSVLSSGEWYKIRVPSTGIYKLSYDQLQNIGLSDPASVRIFGYGGRPLPEDITGGEKDDLQPIGIFMEKGVDNVFNQGDFILFYGIGADLWYYDEIFNMFRCKQNPYSDHGYYFLTCKNGSNDIPPADKLLSETASQLIDRYDYFSHHELSLFNLIKSGREWHGEEFDLITQYEMSFTVPDIIPSVPVRLLTNVLSRAGDSATFVLSVNGAEQQTFRIRPTNLSDNLATFAFNQQKTSSFYSANENISLRLRYLKPDQRAKGWHDFTTLNATAKLRLKDDQLIFRNYSSVSPGAVTEFLIDNAGENIIVWDLTDANNILSVPFTILTGKVSFKSETSVLKEFAVFRKSGNFPSPEYSGTGLGKIDNQNLHGISPPEMIVISAEEFMDQAIAFSEYRSEKDGMNIFVTTPEKICNEFSSGTPDVTAIRNFVKNVYDRSMNDGTPGLKYLLLFGNGSYDNKGILENPGNFVPTYQSENSLSPVFSFASDDYFALLDTGEQMLNGLLDIGVGRIPVRNVSDAEAMVNKIIEYESISSLGNWRNTVCFIADDEDGNIHLSQADQLTVYVNSNYPSLNVNKIFLDAYKQISTPTGQIYPEVNKAINDQVNRGALIINYTGHGGINGLAHEKILEMKDIESWRNSCRFPLFVTATCEFSRFDDPNTVSAGEKVFLHPSGGGIALFTTTRLVYSGPNHALNERFYEIVFQKESQNKSYRLGDVMKYSKNNTGAGINKRNFTLLGDPSLRLSYPKFQIITDSINSIHVSEPVDTLKALSLISISGHIGDNGNVLDSMNGIIIPVVFDKPLQLTTLANDGGDKKSFSLQNNILYKGKVSVKNGRFNFSFNVPKDINYAFGKGKLSYYAHDEVSDASGSFHDFIIGGSSGNYGDDNDGPEIHIYMNNIHFRSGDLTDPNPVLYVKISDESGINTTGIGIGHDISAILDNNYSSPLFLNEYFEADPDSYKGGVIEYPLFDLTEGLHSIAVKVWDIYNNSAGESLEFIVAATEKIFLNTIFNYPNPFNENSWFSFGLGKAGTDIEIIIDIFNSTGELIRTIKANEYNTGYRSEPVMWDGKTSAGNPLPQGMYIYRINITSSDGDKALKSGKLLIIR